MLGKQAQLGELSNVIAQRVGKRLQKRSAAGGARLVEENVVDRAVADLEALHILPADIDNEIHIRQECLGRREMGHRFHDAEIKAEGVLQQLLAVARYGRGREREIRVFAAQFQQVITHNRHRIAGVAAVNGVQHLVVLAHHHGLHRGGSGIHAQVGFALVGGDVAARRAAGVVALAERFVFLLVPEQRGDEAEGGVRVIAGDLRERGVDVDRLHAAVGRAERHKIERIFRADALRLQRRVKRVPQLREERQRAAQIQHLAADRASLRQAGDRLVCHGRKNAGAHVALARALVQKRLHVALGKHAAAGGDGIDFLILGSELVHLVEREIEQRCHLINERTGAAGTGAVHAHFQPAGEEEDLGVLAAQLNDHVRVGDELHGGDSGGVNLLHKGEAARFRHAHAGRTGHRELGRFAVQHLRLDFAQQFRHFLRDLRKMPFVGLVKNLLIVVQHHAFDRGGTHVEANSHVCFLPFWVACVPFKHRPQCGRFRPFPGVFAPASM